jgi:glycosyltransferase involved in cell wall biosynthesis
VATTTQGLARRGHSVTVCSTDVCDASSRLTPPEPQRRWQPWTINGSPSGVTLRVFPNVSNRAAYRFQGFLPCGLDAYMREHAHEFDVAHLHACRNVPGVLAARHLRQARVPYLLAPNGTAPLIERRLWAKRIFDAVAGHRLAHGAARFLAVTEVERRDLQAAFGDAAPIRLVPNSIDLREFDPPVAHGAFRQRAAIGDAPLVLFLGKITPRKRLDIVIRAFAQLRRTDARLVIAGNDMGGATAALALVRRLGLESQTVFTGLLTGRARLEALADADVLVYASSQEIFGLVPLESILSGTPVIVGDDSGCAEVVRTTGGGLLVPVGDAPALTRAIEQILNHQATWRSAATAAAHVVRATYSQDAVCAELERVYEEMTA